MMIDFNFTEDRGVIWISTRTQDPDDDASVDESVNESVTHRWCSSGRRRSGSCCERRWVQWRATPRAESEFSGHRRWCTPSTCLQLRSTATNGHITQSNKSNKPAASVHHHDTERTNKGRGVKVKMKIDEVIPSNSSFTLMAWHGGKKGDEETLERTQTVTGEGGQMWQELTFTESGQDGVFSPAYGPGMIQIINQGLGLTHEQLNQLQNICCFMSVLQFKGNLLCWLMTNTILFWEDLERLEMTRQFCFLSLELTHKNIKMNSQTPVIHTRWHGSLKTTGQ